MQTQITTTTEPAPASNSRPSSESARYAKTIETSKRVRWDIDRDVLRGRELDFSSTRFLPDGLTKLNELSFLNQQEHRLLSQIQGRTYANIFGLVERYINAKVLELSHDHWFGDQKALEALVRFSDEELKHQELFRRLEQMIASGMPRGYRFLPDPNGVANVVLSKSTWAVLALTCHIELFTQVHYRESIEPDSELSPLFKDVFLYHWKEESQHAILDELEWRRADAKLTPAERDRAVDDFISLVGAVDGLLVAQADADVGYFLDLCPRHANCPNAELLQVALLRAYRWQYIVSGAQHPRFGEVLSGLVTPEQLLRINQALAPLVG